MIPTLSIYPGAPTPGAAGTSITYARSSPGSPIFVPVLPDPPPIHVLNLRNSLEPGKPAKGAFPAKEPTRRANLSLIKREIDSNGVPHSCSASLTLSFPDDRAVVSKADIEGVLHALINVALASTEPYFVGGSNVPLITRIIGGEA